MFKLPKSFWFFCTTAHPSRASTKWDDTLKSTVTATHATCDRVFRSVIEDWKSVAGIQPSAPSQQLVAGEIESESHDAVGMSAWKGIYEGSERVIALLGLVQAHIDNATGLSGTVRIGLLTDLTTRMLSVAVPAAGRQEFVKPNHQVSRDERDALYSLLPRIHVATFKLLASILHRFGSALLSVLPSLTEQLAWVFKAERADERFRATSYVTLGQYLTFVGQTFGKDEVADIAPLIAACCFDMLPEDDQTRLPTASNGVKQSAAQAASQTTKTSTVSTPQSSTLQTAASALLPLILSKLDPKVVPRKLRASIDRTAILTKHKQALVASVLNPPVNPSGTAAQASLLPFLARLFPGDAEVEAIIRPRMPVTWTGRRSGEEEDEDDDDEEDINVDEMEVDESAMPETDLLSALDEQLGNKPAERPASEEAAEMAEVTTDITPSAETATTSKRAALAEPEPAVPAKRLRASPVAEAVAEASPRDLPGPDPVTARASVPTTVVTRSAKAQQTVTLPAQNAPAAAADEADDGSDFEMPPLTMESSGDEDEGEEEEDDDA